ncbi:hypothetical protein B0A52_02161 [Exophiala mesophila]|uniref:Uncharacterized protein n=1 Tax=Exophiala mesophila TaxID=212818 RepID=A0A438NB77_EXOME|nr:hypothetical protein B0A52_02161 [Exophiala mesophila]
MTSAGTKCRRLTQVAFVALTLCVLFIQKPSLIPLPGYQQLVGEPRTWDAVAGGDARMGSSVIPVTSAYKPLEVDILADFPKKIVQTTTTAGKRDFEQMWKSWRDLNPDYTYWIMKGESQNFRDILGPQLMHLDDVLDEFVDQHFSVRPAIKRFWKQLNTPVLRTDFLRYLVMFARGGVYSDIDTSIIKPIHDWIPRRFLDDTEKPVNVVVGIERDETKEGALRPIGFAQWTLMTKPGHELFEKAIYRVMSNIEFLAGVQRVPVDRVVIPKADAVEATGPGMFTDVVVEVLREQGIGVDWLLFSNLTEPMLLGDILFLPINAFCGRHCRSDSPEYGDVYVQHHHQNGWFSSQSMKYSEQKTETA